MSLLECRDDAFESEDSNAIDVERLGGVDVGSVSALDMLDPLSSQG